MSWIYVENLLRQPGNKHEGEDILVHEFSHAIETIGIKVADPILHARLEQAYTTAMAKGLWQRTYAAQDMHEYWAEGVQDWFDCNIEKTPPNGIHNEINTRKEIKQYDPELAAILMQVFGDKAVTLPVK